MKNTINVLKAIDTLSAMESAGIPTSDALSRLVENNTLEPVGDLVVTGPIRAFIKDWYAIANQSTETAQSEPTVEISGKKTSAGKKLSKLAGKLSSTSTGDLIETVVAIGATTLVNAGSGIVRSAFISGASKLVETVSGVDTTQYEDIAHKANAVVTGATIAIDAVRVIKSDEARKEVIADARAIYSKAKSVTVESYEKFADLI